MQSPNRVYRLKDFELNCFVIKLAIDVIIGEQFALGIAMVGLVIVVVQDTRVELDPFQK